VIAEEGDDSVCSSADHIIRVPRTPTLLAPLVTTVPLQVSPLRSREPANTMSISPATWPSR